MIAYNPEFLDITSFLSQEQNNFLISLAQGISLDSLITETQDEKSIANKLCFDFIYTSAIIEGNTYTRGEAQTLFETRKPISSKSIDEANMLLNIKAALEYVLEEKPPITKHTIREIHQMLSQGLLPKKAQGGVRDIAVTIGNSDYIPLNNPQELEVQMDKMLTYFNKIFNPFDKAIYIHNNLAYLQYFQDCNKRLARIVQNLSLLNDGLPFLSFNALRAATEIKAQYKDAMLAYYEKGETKNFVDFFVREYANTLQTLQNFQNLQHKLDITKAPQANKSLRQKGKTR
ncbi:Fic family protein [Helicobacter sp. MIT 21-1697]|uniref:Fic family protein n=1 Tax=Helicobacter sp. MIT 21-1697 TaxID=2993733 RepID=UPI00224B5F11|nr:Fic family protein [Helicobacter sp. MIT 21-1697]MCX2716814.1 Fic family protein [Helicobacter sp. MIT 21-1697]